MRVKWSTLSKQECAIILKNLKANSSLFRWNREKENLGIIAKKIPEKESLRKDGYLAFDLEDFEDCITQTLSL